jgi:hypothetical protein
MNKFVFEQKQKTLFGALMLVGLVSMGITYATDDQFHTRFWSNFLQHSVFFTLIAFTATFFIAATTLAYAGWHTLVKRIVEAQTQLLGVGLILMGILAVTTFGNVHHLYHWADAKAVSTDVILKGKSAFLNKGWYGLATFGFLGVWFFFATKLRSLSLQQDASDFDITYPYYRKMKVWGAAFMPIGGFTSAAAIWLWLMSVDAHWYSTMFAWYTTASAFVSMIAITILLTIYLKSKGYLQEVTNEHLHDLGKFLFAFSIFWTYLWFSQYMLIWYSNNGEETVYFWQRLTKFPVLFYGNFVLNFILPFLILLRNDTKRKIGTLVFTASIVLFGHWWDYLQMAKIAPYLEAQHHLGHGAHDSHSDAEHGAANHGAANHGDAHGAAAQATPAHGAASHAADTAHAGHAAHGEAAHGAAQAADHGHAVATSTVDIDINEGYFQYKPEFVDGIFVPGFLELGTFLGFAGLFLFLVFRQLEKASLIPTNDPYLDEALHHHVGYGGEYPEDGHH